MYSTPNLQISDLVNNVLEVINDEKGIGIKISTQLETYFYTENKRKAFYKSYNREDEQEKIKSNHRKIPTVYCTPKYRNLLAIHMLSELSSKPQAKYRTAGCQHKFVPAPGTCLVYQTHWELSSYLSDSGRIYIITEPEKVIDYVIPEHFYKPISQDTTSPLYITPFTLVYQIPRSGSNSLPDFLQCGKQQKREQYLDSVYQTARMEENLYASIVIPE